MTFETLVFIHDLLSKEEKAREEREEKAVDALLRTAPVDENYSRVEALCDSTRKSLYDAKRALYDFESANWHC